MKGRGSRGTSRVRLRPEDPELLRPPNVCWTEVPESITTVIPSPEPAAAEEQASTGRHGVAAIYNNEYYYCCERIPTSAS